MSSLIELLDSKQKEKIRHMNKEELFDFAWQLGFDDCVEEGCEYYEGYLFGRLSVIKELQVLKKIGCASSIYVITDGKYYKIGKSNDVSKRLKALQTSNPRKLTLVKSYNFANEKLAFSVETLLHQKFGKYKVQGEWFDFTQVGIGNGESLEQEIVNSIEKMLIEWEQEFEKIEEILR